MTFEEADKILNKMVSEWYLRMESLSFLMIVHKDTNMYHNIYANQFPKGMLKIFADKMDKHPAIK